MNIILLFFEIFLKYVILYIQQEIYFKKKFYNIFNLKKEGERERKRKREREREREKYKQNQVIIFIRLPKHIRNYLQHLTTRIYNDYATLD